MRRFRTTAAGRIARAVRTATLGAAVLAASLPASAEGTDPPADRDFHALTPQLARWIDEAVSGNPSLAAARAGARADRARVELEGGLPDPMAGYRYFGGSPETRVGPQIQSLEVSQRLPWRGKRAVAEQRAELMAVGSEADVLDRERALALEVKRAYFEAAFLREALAVNGEEADLLRRFEAIALTRYSTGTGIQQSVIKVQTDISRLADQAIGLEAHLEHLEHGIASLLGDPDRPLVVEPVSLPLLDLEVGGVLHHADNTADHSRTRSLRHRIEADRALVRRRELDSRPDVSFGLSYTQVNRREDAAGRLTPPEGNGDDIWSVGVQMNIPLYRRKVRAGVVAAQESERASQRRLQELQNGLGHEIHGAVLRVAAIERRARLHDEVIIPQAGESLASAEAAYTTGRLDFLDLLDAERVLFRARLAAHRLRADYWIALAELEFALGRPFPDIDSAGGSRP